MASSGMRVVGSAFRRTEPERIKGSCGMVVILERIISRGMVLRSRLSSVIVPEELSRMRRKTERRELLPLRMLVNENHAKEELHLPTCPTANANFLSLFDAE